jgi:hypothetical protein
VTVSVSSLFTPQSPAQWLATLLADGNSLGLTATAWQPGQFVRTILAILGEELAKEDAFAISLRAQGCFLDFAASGSVTFTDDLVANNPQTVTVPVTPDPSIPSQNPTGAPGLLDTLASSVYNVVRTSATFATGPVWISNTSGVNQGSFQPGTFHVQNVLTGATYANQVVFANTASALTATVTAATVATPVIITTAAPHGLSTGAVAFVQGIGVCPDNFYVVTSGGATTLTLNGSIGAGIYSGAGQVWATQSVIFAGDAIGPQGNAGVGNINQLITAAPKCYCGNLVTLAGAPWQSNASLAAICRAKLATLTPNGPQGAYLFFALAASTILAGGALANGLVLASPLPVTPVTLDGGPITRALVSQSTATGIVLTTLANASGPVGGCYNLGITGATTAAPIAITTAASHNLVTGDYVQVNGVQGLLGANGVRQITRIDGTHFSLNGSSGAGSYTAATGQVTGGDLYAVAVVLQAYACPNAVTQQTASASAVATVIAATVYVPASFTGDYTTKMTAALTAYISSFPIGGLNVDGAVNVLPLGAIEGILYSAGQSAGVVYTLSVTGVTINASPADLALSASGVAILGTLAGIVVVGV